MQRQGESHNSEPYELYFSDSIIVNNVKAGQKFPN